jgi:HEAT repeat protein
MSSSVRTTPLAGFAFLLAAAAAGQTPAGQQPAGQQPADKPAKVTEWPAPKPEDRDRLPGLYGQLKKDNEALRKEGRDALIAIGDAAVPFLFQQVGDKEAPVNTEVFTVLDKITGPQHASLLAKELGKKGKLELRKYLFGRLCRFVDPELKATLTGGLKDKEESIVFHSTLGLAALRELSALEPLLEACRTDWNGVRAEVAAVLPAARCEQCGKAVAELIAKGKPPVQAAGLRLMRYVATPPQAAMVKTYLRAEDFVVKKEAINAMRVINGMEPIENLDAFQATKMAEEWQNK